MKGIILNPAITEPFTNPTAAPPSTQTRTTKGGAMPFSNNAAPRTLVSATTEPTLKSIPPLIMIMVIPSAPSATITV